MAENKEHTGKTAYDWVALILGTGATVTEQIFGAKNAAAESEVAFHETEAAKAQKEAEYVDLVKKVAIGVVGIFAVMVGFKFIKKL